MKTSKIKQALLLVGPAALSLASSPVLRAQMSQPTDSAQNSKVIDSSTDQHSTTTGNPTDQPGALDRTSSRDTTNSLDSSPSLAPTGSADKSATKEPNDTPKQEATTQNKSQETSHKSSDETASTKPTSDKDFLLNAAQGGMTEVELGKLAQQNAASPDVKQFGSRMVTDHSKANDDLKTVAQKEGLTIPDSLDAKHQATVNRLSKLSGPAFDRAYVHAMVKDHEKDAAEFRQESTSAQDPDVKTFAGNTLKVIEAHLSHIKSIQSKMQQ